MSGTGWLKRGLSLLGLAALTLSITSGHSFSSEAPLRIALAASANNRAIEAVVPIAKAQGLDVKLVEFSDWISPNVALAEGSVDLNFYQHIPFLEASKAGNGYDFVPVGIGFISVSGIYSKKLTSLDQLKDGATVTVSNDPTNLGRALLLLQDAGLVKLRDGANYTATPEDIVENPKRLKIVPLEAQQVVRSIDDTDIAVTFPSFLRLVGVDPNGALFYEKPSEIWAIRFVARPDNQHDERIAKFIKIYQSAPETKAALRQLYGDLVSFGWEK